MFQGSSISDGDWDHFRSLFDRFSVVFASPQHEAAFRSDLSRYLVLLLSANEHTNLTSIRSFDVGLWKHLYDSLVLVACEPLGSVLDWGTGGGLPGIPLALLRRSIGSTCSVSLLDSVKKKAALVSVFCRELGLADCSVFSERGETIVARSKFESVVMRAVAPPDRAIPWMVRSVRRYVFMTGPAQVADWRGSVHLAEKRGFGLVDIQEFVLPEGGGTRFLVRFHQK